MTSAPVREPPPQLPLAAVAPGLVPGVARIFLLDADTAFEGNAELLSTAERARAARFVFERDRGRWVRGRLFLRAVLARVLDRAAAALPITAEASLAPALADDPGVRLSLARSGGAVLVGIARDTAIGVDVERMEDVPERAEVARIAFTPTEIRHVAATPPEARTGAFLRIWTRKEAAVKAWGLGLSAPTARIEVLGPDGATPVRLDELTCAVTDLAVGERLVGAFAGDVGSSCRLTRLAP